MYRVGVDIGGTFTDIVFVDEASGSIAVGKVLTTHDDLSVGMLSGIREMLARLEKGSAGISNVVQGTTLVSNALIERKGARIGLLTTRGFRDVLETRNEKRYDLYDFNARLPEPLVERRHRLGVTERLDERGSVVTPIDPAEVAELVGWLVEAGVESIAVCLLHSYQNAAHERVIRDVISSRYPSLSVSLSSDIAPQIREYPRTSTTVANAYVSPLIARYVDAMTEAFGALGFERGIYMLVSGAVVTDQIAKQVPIRLVDSGAAAGAVAAAYYSQLLDRDRVISFEMGGTTAKFCFVDHSQPAFTNEFEVARVDRFRKGSGLAIALPALDMVEIGAGGGSIAWVDELGLLKVGPRSAGASPGPACYAIGGREPTVSDANLVLGYLNPDYFLGGRMRLDADLAQRAIGQVAEPLGLGIAEAAWGIHRIVTENMVNAARAYIAEVGRDARAYTLVAFGGPGPAHAVRFAQKLGIKEVVIPWGAGVASAIGALTSAFGFDFVRTYIARLSSIDWRHLNELLSEMEREACSLLEGAGVAPADVSVSRFCNMRYVGQTHEIRVPIPGGELGPEQVATIQRAYADEYERLYQHPNLDYALECINWRVFASGPRPRLHLDATPATSRRSAQSARKGRRRAYFPENGDYQQCPVYDRSALAEGATIVGPAIVEEAESTLVVPPGAEVTVSAYGALVIRLEP